MQSTPTKADGDGPQKLLLYDPLTDKGHVTRTDIKDCTVQRGPGPSCYADRFKWPERCWSKLRDDERHRFCRNMRKFRASSHMSGCRGMELILDQILLLVNKQTGEMKDLRCVHVCDSADHCQNLLASIDSRHRPKHIHNALEDRLPLQLYLELKEMIPMAMFSSMPNAVRTDASKRSCLISSVTRLTWHVRLTAWCMVLTASCTAMMTQMT